MIVFDGMDFDNHLNLIVAKPNHLQNDDYDGPFEIIFNRPLPSLISHEASSHENVVRELSFVDRT